MKYKYIFIIGFWFISFNGYHWIHEFAGHYLANLLCGVSINQMEIIWQRIILLNINIMPIAVTVLEGEIPNITPFAGGFMAGLIFLILSLFIFWKVIRRKQEQFWWVFAIALGFSGSGFTEFVIEGFFREYHRGFLGTLLLAFFAFLFPMLLGIWHYRNRILGWCRAI